LHGVGVSCTNALSEWMVTTVNRDGKVYEQRYEKGIPMYDVKVVGKSKANGTTQHWKPDPTVLTHTEHDVHILKKRMRELAYLNPVCTIEFVSEINTEDSETFRFEKGIVQLVEDVSDAEHPLHKPIYFHRVREGMEV